MTRRIVYLSWPASEISGGIKLAYRHVETLVAEGYEAVVATPDGLPPRWFESSAATIHLEALSEPDDVLVYPENHLGLLQTHKSWQCPKVVFCQNQFMAFRGLGGVPCYSDFGVTDVLAEGRLVADFCGRRFPKLRCWQVPVYVDSGVFRVASRKRLQIVFMPRKRAMEAGFIKDLFRAENTEFRDIPWVPVAGKSEAEVAALLASSALYLALGRFESYGMSLLEAMASGCICAGFSGIGGTIYTTACNGFWASEDDCLDCATQLARATRLVVAGGDACSEMVSAAVNDARRHNRGRFDEKVVRFWKGFLERSPAAKTQSIPV